MPRFGLIVEGPYDGVVLKELVLKCHQKNCDVEVRVCGGNIKQKFRTYLQEFKYRGDIDKAFVVRDSDGRDAAKLKAEYEALISERDYPFPVNVAIVIQELEAWLLADEDAVSFVAGRHVMRVPDPIEEMRSPKERLKSSLSRGKAYTAELARQIAEKANIARIADHCPAFRRFCAAAGDC